MRERFEAMPARASARVAVHLGAGMPAKRWPVEHWREVIRQLAARQCQVILIGGGGDRRLAREVLAGQERPAIVDWTGSLTLVESAALVEQCDLFVGADSGPAHLAAAVGTPGVVLFSGTNDARQWCPCGSEVAVVGHLVACSPCHRQVCPLAEHPCMRGLSPQTVLLAIDAMLARREPAESVHLGLDAFARCGGIST
jgi:ADP-heptose:LPS heptosyltransferase